MGCRQCVDVEILPKSNIFYYVSVKLPGASMRKIHSTHGTNVECRKQCAHVRSQLLYGALRSFLSASELILHSSFEAPLVLRVEAPIESKAP